MCMIRDPESPVIFVLSYNNITVFFVLFSKVYFPPCIVFYII